MGEAKRRRREPQPRDTRISYGIRCTWWDSIYNVGTLPTHTSHRLPCCPHCKGLLFEKPDEAAWWAGADEWEAKGHPGYREMLTWARGKCFPNMKAVEVAYHAARPLS